MADAFLGLDVGTSSLKALVCDLQGRVLGTASSDYAFATPQPGYSEQDPDLWVRGAIDAIPQALARAGMPGSRVAAIGLDGQMHGAVLVDRVGAPLRPAILWNDGRSAGECERLTRELGAAEIVARTGNRLLPGFTAPKIAWVQAHEPETWARTAQVLLPKDYLRSRLGGEWATDVSDASGTLLFDVAGRRWSDAMLRDLRIAPSLVPPAHESAQPVDRLNATMARATGLVEGTPLVAGAGDQAAGAVGTGVVDPGRLSCVLGTSGVIFAAGDRFRSSPDGALHAFCHAAPGRWHLMSVMLSAAGSMRWFADALCHATPAELDALAADAPAFAEGLVFLPTLGGERCPYPDAYATGAFVGATLSHSRAHFARAVIEGVTASMALCLDMMRDAGVPVRDLAISGGGFHSQLWTQAMADALGAPLVRMAANEGAALGSALLSAVGVGAFASVQDAVAHMKPTDCIQPAPAERDAWRALMTRQRAVYEALRPVRRS